MPLCLFAFSSSFAVNAPLFSNKIAAIVNDDVITLKELNARVNRLIAEGKIPQLVPAATKEQVLVAMTEQLIQEQRAEKLGVTISNTQWDQLVTQYASRRNMTVESLKEQYELVGVDFEGLRNEVKAGVIIQKLLRRDAIRRITVDKQEIDEFVKSNNIQPKERKYDLTHIFIKADASSNQDALKEGVDKVAKVNQFDLIAKMLRQEGYNVDEKQIQSESLSKLPTVFANAVKSLNIGDVSNVIATSAGVHILKVNKIEGAGTLIEKRKAQHILIAGSSALEIARANNAITRLKGQLRNGEEFTDLATYYSDDSGSAANGGDLGWVRKGQMVPQFEKALFSMQEGQISEPVQTAYGVHIIKLNKVSISSDPDEEVREIAFNALMTRKVEQFYPVWLSELVANSYVKYM